MSLLPTMGSLMATQDTNKQLSSIRSYLSQLQESMEAELMNIGIDNLSGELKKKLETMSDDIMVQSNEVQDLQTSLVTAEQVNAIVGKFDFVTTSVLSAEVAAINRVVATKVTAAQVDAQIGNFNYANIGIVTAGTIGTYELNAGKITSGTLAAARISTDIMRANAFTASNIAAKFTSAENSAFGRINCSEYRLQVGNNSYPLSVHSIVSGGKLLFFLGTETEPK